MNVLIACEESQRVCEAFRAKGHNAFSSDIIECSGGHPEWHIQGDVLPLLDGNCTFETCDKVKHSINGEWDMIIAFPPCTYMTCAGACRMYPTKGNIDYQRLALGLEAAAFFYKIYSAKCKRIAIENPKPLSVIPLIEETQHIQPYEFALDESEYFTKQTYLWLKGLPKLIPLRTSKPEGTMPFVNAGSKTANGEPRKKRGCKSSAKDRSKTFSGVALAMANQWG